MVLLSSELRGEHDEHAEPVLTDNVRDDPMAKACYRAVRYLPILLRDKLHQEGIWEDFRQELRLVAWEAEREHLSEGDTFRLAARRIYAFLRAYGYWVYRHCYYKPEKPLSSLISAEDEDDEARQEERLLAREIPAPAYIAWREPLDERVMALLKASGGLSKRDLYYRLGISARELEWHLSPLLKQGLVIEVKRPNRSRPLTPLLLAVEPGQQLPLSPVVDRDEQIRHAYFVEGRGIKQIAREFQHSKRTVRDALIDAGAEIKGKGRRKRRRH